MRVLVVLGTAAVLTACNRGSTAAIPVPTLPTPTAAQTVYAGTITDSIGGGGSLTVSLGASGSSVGGTWLATFPGQKASNRVVSGTLNGTSYSATVSDCIDTDDFGCGAPNCRQTFTGTLTSTGFSGTYAEVPSDACTAHSGTVSATRQ